MSSSNGPDLGVLLSMGMTMAVCVIGGFGLGWLVDQPSRSFPAFALVGLGLGVVAASAFVYAQLKRYM